jgi:DNA-binding NarL/FixJ family response regulator
MTLEVGEELSMRLRQVARTSKRTPEQLAIELLARGLEKRARRNQVQAILDQLTPREQEVARFTARGYTNRQIAEALVVSPETVKTHVRHVREKLGVHSKAELRLLLLDLRIRWWERNAKPTRGAAYRRNARSGGGP